MIFLQTQDDILLRFDIDISFTNLVRNTVTSNPVEFGASISDHTYTEPIVFTLTAGVSNTFFGGNNTDIVNAPSRFIGDSTGTGDTRRQAAWFILTRLQALGEPVNLISDLEIIPNVIITEITNLTDVNTSKSLIPTLTFQQVILTESEIGVITVERLQEGDKNVVGDQVDRGDVQQESTPDSLLFKISDFFGVAP